MRDRDLIRQVDLINNLIKEAGSLAYENEFLQSHLSGYICIRVSGYFENAVSSIVYAYAKNRSHKHIAAYVDKTISRLTNINSVKLKEIVGSLSPDLRQKLEDFFDDSQKESSLNSLVNIRNTIAHGKDHGVTVVQANDYFKQCKEIVGFLEEIMPAN